VTTRFVVTGCGRSGTGYISALFEALGIRCGHEDVFNPWAETNGGPISWPSDLNGEASWLAAPHLASLPPGTVVFHQTRDPVQVVRSFVRIRFFEEPSEYLTYAESHIPRLARGSLLERSVRYWVEWNEMAAVAGQHHDLRYRQHRLEDLDAALVVEMLGELGVESSTHEVQKAIEATPRDTNTRGTKHDDHLVQLKDVADAQLRDALIAASAAYGYSLGRIG